MVKADLASGTLLQVQAQIRFWLIAGLIIGLTLLVYGAPVGAESRLVVDQAGLFLLVKPLHWPNRPSASAVRMGWNW